MDFKSPLNYILLLLLHRLISVFPFIQTVFLNDSCKSCVLVKLQGAKHLDPEHHVADCQSYHTVTLCLTVALTACCIVLLSRLASCHLNKAAF